VDVLTFRTHLAYWICKGVEETKLVATRQKFKDSIELKIPFVVGSIDIKKLVGTMFQKKI